MPDSARSPTQPLDKMVLKSFNLNPNRILQSIPSSCRHKPPPKSSATPIQITSFLAINVPTSYFLTIGLKKGFKKHRGLSALVVSLNPRLVTRRMTCHACTRPHRSSIPVAIAHMLTQIPLGKCTTAQQSSAQCITVQSPALGLMRKSFAPMRSRYITRVKFARSESTSNVVCECIRTLSNKFTLQQKACFRLEADSAWRAYLTKLIFLSSSLLNSSVSYTFIYSASRFLKSA